MVDAKAGRIAYAGVAALLFAAGLQAMCLPLETFTYKVELVTCTDSAPRLQERARSWQEREPRLGAEWFARVTKLSVAQVELRVLALEAREEPPDSGFAVRPRTPKHAQEVFSAALRASPDACDELREREHLMVREDSACCDTLPPVGFCLLGLPAYEVLQ